MKIDGFHIDGYGLHHDLGVTDLPAGLTIVAGPNEAGKTTLQHFLVGMLFGFTPVNRPDHHKPLRGGTYGGRLFITDDNGRPLTIHRGARRSSLAITGPDGPVSEAELSALLGNATRDLYQSIFAVHVDELDELKALSDAQVRDRVFSAGVLGAGRTAQRALSQLADERDALLKPGGRSPDKYLLKRLRGDLVDARTDLADAQRSAKGLPALLGRIGVLEQDRRREREQRESIQAERSLLAAVAELWPTWADAADARAELAQLGKVAAVDADTSARLNQAISHQAELVEVRDRDAEALAAAEAALAACAPPGLAAAESQAIAALVAAAPIAAERMATIAELTGEVERLSTELRVTLGADRDEAWLASQPDRGEASVALRAAADAVRAADHDLAATRARHRDQAARLDDDLADVTAAEASLAEAPHLPLDRARQAADDANTLVALVTEREAASQRAALAAGQTSAAGMPGFLVPSLAVLAAVVALSGVAALLSGAPIAGVAAIAGALSLAGVAVGVHRSTASSIDAGAPAGASPIAPEADTTVAGLDEAIAPILKALGLDERPTLAEATNLRSKAEHLAGEAARLHQERERVAAQRRALTERSARHHQRAEAEMAAATQAQADAVEGWRACLLAHHLPASLDPAGADQWLDTLAKARRTLRSLTDARAALARQTETHAAFVAQVCATVDAVGLDLPTNPAEDPLRAITALDDALTGDRAAEVRRREATNELEIARSRYDESALRSRQTDEALASVVAELGAETVPEAQALVERAATAQQLESRVHRAERDLVAAVGSRADRLDAARSLLGQADPTRWHDELVALERDLRAADDRIDDITTELAHLTRERDELEHSADVPRCELRVTDLEAQLTDALTRWASLTVAHQLVETTLARYQRERQPDVVKRAAAHFAQVTGGRYPRLEVHDREVLAIDDTGREVPADALSTGTTQQLYLSMRFALAESYARTARLPLLLDDITVNADGGRLPRLADTIADVAADHQVFVFTCHDATVELLTAAAPEARLLTLEPPAEGRRLGLAAG